MKESVSGEQHSPAPTRKRMMKPSESRRLTIGLVSYPRSGNSLMRSLIEDITGIYTGSDTRPDRSLSVALKESGFLGEGVVKEEAYVIKTHYPERWGYKRFNCHKVILLARNPFDAMDSYFNLNLTNTHTTSMRDDQYVRFKAEV